MTKYTEELLLDLANKLLILKNEGYTKDEIANLEGWGYSRYKYAARFIKDNSLTLENSVMQETSKSEEIASKSPEIQPKKAENRKSKNLSPDEIKARVATDELTVPFSNWLSEGGWVRETAEPVDIYETDENGEQVLVGQKLDPGVMWPTDYTGAKTYSEIMLEGVPERRASIKEGYILTAQQEQTPLCGPVWITIAALSAARGHYPIGVGGFTYSKKWFQRRGKKDTTEIAPWPSLIEKLITRKRVDISPELQFAAEMNILPTAAQPLTGLNNYINATTTVFAHPKRAIESVPRNSWERPISMWTTGACSVPNYILQKAGLKALKDHTTGCVIVEIDYEDRVFIRNVDIDPITGEAIDVDLHVIGGLVRQELPVREEILEEAPDAEVAPVLTLGCIHRRGLNRGHANASWSLFEKPADDMSIIDTVRPAYQIFHDLLDGQSINHHEDTDPFALYARHVKDRGSLDEELDQVVEFLKDTRRPWTTTIVVDSNHNDFVRRWLLKPSNLIDVCNSKLWHLLNWQVRDAIDRGEKPAPFQMIMRERVPDTFFEFAGPDDHCEIFGHHFNYHGDKSPNGARGSTVGLSKMGIKIIKAHDHQLTWRDGVISIGNLLGKADYAVGATSWAGAFALTHRTGHTQVCTMIDDKWRA